MAEWITADLIELAVSVVLAAVLAWQSARIGELHDRLARIERREAERRWGKHAW